MTRLCDLSFEDVRVGSRVRSTNTSREGVITAKRDVPEDRHPSVDILWDNGKESWGVFLLWGEHVEVLDAPA